MCCVTRRLAGRLLTCAASTDFRSNVLQLETKFGGMEVSEAKRLKALEEENAKLKKLLAEQMLDVAALREFLGEKW